MKKITIGIIILTSIILFLLSHIIYAKYITSDNLMSKISISSPIFMVEGKETAKISEINNIGYYEFLIKNFNESDTSEIGFWYTIEVDSNTDESIKFELYNEEIPIPLENLKTKELFIKGNEKIEQKYKLKIIYENIQCNEGKEIFEEVQIKVYSQQEKI